MRTNKLLLDVAIDNEVCNKMENRIDVINATLFYSISHLFQLSSLLRNSLCFIERCFPMVAESHNFVELDFIHVRKMFSSSELNIDSEIQVLNAADGWLCHKITDRSKYAKDLLLRIRLLLLSDAALNYILKSKSSFSINPESAAIIKEA